MNVIGISAFYHESACCLIQDGKLIAAVEEERFSRLKHDPQLPLKAFRYCLKAGKIGPGDVDCVAYYEQPSKKLSRQLWAGHGSASPARLWQAARRPEWAIRDRLGCDCPIRYYDHHRSHAAASFLFSGFREAAILTVDGVGEWATTTYGIGRDMEIDLFEEVAFPHSLGLLYSAVTGYLGFETLGGEYKVMGLAPYGTPRFAPQLRSVVRTGAAGQYELDLRYFDFTRSDRMYTPDLCDLLGSPPRTPESDLGQFHSDVASSLQLVLEEILLEKVRYLHERTGARDLCMGGGVAHNVVANGRIRREGPFKRLFVQPAAGDAGSCLGAAALAWIEVTGQRHTSSPLEHVYLGPNYSAGDVAALLDATGVAALDYRNREADLVGAVADRLLAGKVVAWFHGRLEMGARALGARSILADPRDPEVRERLNRLVKMRESFRPFAPSVLYHHAQEYFDIDHPSPFMLEVCEVRSPVPIPAVTHVNNSARPQTVDPRQSPRYARLIEAFYERTGCPLVVNTSFNVRGEPIVCSPSDALLCLVSSDIDALVLEDFLIDREMLPPDWKLLVEGFRSLTGRNNPARSAIYTFL